jgi:ankyrin repeat protein
MKGMYRLTGSAVMAVLLSVSLFAANRSDVADAVMRGDTAVLKTLLEQKADVNAPQADGSTALHWAAYRQDVATAETLMRAGANVKQATREGATPLSLASINGDAAMIEALLRGGADANEQVANGESALMFASRTGALDAMKVLLAHGASVNLKEKLRGTTALMWAAAQVHPAAIKLLLDNGADVGARSNPAEKPASGLIAKGSAPAEGAIINGVVVKPKPRDENFGTAQERKGDLTGGGLTPLVFATRRNDVESVKVLLAGGADINQVTEYGWSPLLVATQNRYYQLGAYLLEHGADPSLANKGGWSPLYLAVDNRNIEGGDYPVRKGDMDHLDFIKMLLDKGADVNTRAKDNTERRTVFTAQWVNEEGATPFWRASQSSDLVVMRLLLAHGADPKIATVGGVTPLQVASGIGWVVGSTYEWSEKDNVEAVRLLLELGSDPNAVAETGRTALHGAGHKGRTAVIQMLVDAGAKLDARDYGMTGSERGGRLELHTWQPVDYADGLVRIGTQSAIYQPEAAALLRKLMTERGLPIPPPGRTIESVCMATEICTDVKEQ